MTEQGYAPSMEEVLKAAVDGGFFERDEVDRALARHDDRLRTLAVAERAPRHKVGDPIVLPSSKYVYGLLVRPCSRKHRLLVLQGFLILSCRKCSMVRFEDGEDQS